LSFDSPLFIFFFFIFWLIYAFLPDLPRARRTLLVAAGMFFLAAGSFSSLAVFVGYGLLLYGFSFLISRSNRLKTPIFILALVLNFLALCVFRFSQNRIGFFPLGFSFYSFASITYLVDVYLKRTAVRFCDYAPAVSFFPTILSGPIVRLSELATRIGNPEVLDWSRARFFAVLICNGFFKKAVSEWIAGSLIESSQWPASGRMAWIQAVVFTAKYYADFSGYSDIAVGVAGLLGIHIPNNFRLPFLAVSIGDFWRRWHVTLNQWMVEYVFQPLVYSNGLAFLNYVPKIGTVLFENRQYFAVILAMLGIGLWHGITLNFAAWGLYMALFLCLEMLLGRRFGRLIPRALQILLSFFVVLNGFVIFMHSSPAGAIAMYARMYSFHFESDPFGLSYGVAALAVLAIPHAVDYVLIKNRYFQDKTIFAIPACLILLTIHFLLDGFNGASFEYFKF
jgi:D-alanyl-lipoteichoic acid acyltransferase DltB (MBOAT superfamily)